MKNVKRNFIWGSECSKRATFILFWFKELFMTSFITHPVRAARHPKRPIGSTFSLFCQLSLLVATSLRRGRPYKIGEMGFSSPKSSIIEAHKMYQGAICFCYKIVFNTFNIFSHSSRVGKCRNLWQGFGLYPSVGAYETNPLNYSIPNVRKRDELFQA